MTKDARFEDGGDRPIKLRGLDVDDLKVVSSLVQDSVFPASEMTWQISKRRFAILLNRFRWEDRDNAAARQRDYERVQSVLMFEDVQKVQSQGVPHDDPDTILSILTIEFQAGEDGTGRVLLNLAGDGAIALEVETLDVALTDVTRPYVAVSKQVPDHGE